jgi:hypothetical protein
LTEGYHASQVNTVADEEAVKISRRGCFGYAASLGDAFEREPLERPNAGDRRSVPEADNSQTGRRTGLGRTGSRQFYRPMIVAMAVMWVMQPSVHKVIDVITVWHLFVSAARTMRMRAPGFERAAHGVGIANLDNMFVDMIFMHVMQMTIVQIIDMVVMAYSRVPTVGTMLMCVIRMMPLGAGGHGFAHLRLI